METNNKLSIDTSTWNVKLERRKRGRMKISVKLSKEESEGFTAFMQAVKPDHIDDDTFCKVVFLEGIENMNNKLTQVATDYIEAQKAELVEKGELKEDATFDEVQEVIQRLAAEEQLKNIQEAVSPTESGSDEQGT